MDDLSNLCDKIIEFSSVRNIPLPLNTPKINLNNYICFLIGKIDGSPLPTKRVVIPLRLIAKHVRNQEYYLIEFMFPSCTLCIWVKSLACIKTKIFEMTDKTSFLRSTFVWIPELNDFFRLSSIFNHCECLTRSDPSILLFYSHNTVLLKSY
jgi:hypothetical protein